MPVAGGGSDAVVSAASRQPGNRVVHAVSYKYMMMGLSLVPASAVAITRPVQPPLAGRPHLSRSTCGPHTTPLAPTQIRSFFINEFERYLTRSVKFLLTSNGVELQSDRAMVSIFDWRTLGQVSGLFNCRADVGHP